MPSTTTLGEQVHHSSSGTPDMAEGMWFPHPRHVFFAKARVRNVLWGVQRRLEKFDYLQHSPQVAPIHILAVDASLVIITNVP